MLVTVLYNDQFMNFDLKSDSKLNDLYKLLSFETNIALSQIDLMRDGNSIQEDCLFKTLSELSFNDNDLLVLKAKEKSIPSNESLSLARNNTTSNIASNTSSNNEFMIQSNVNHSINNTGTSGNNNFLDPLDIETQKRIEQTIRNENIHRNLAKALEEHPESFTSVSMLFVPIHINGHLVRAFVDCGAQATIMSQSCAKRCNIERLIDERWNGIARGVGEGKIIGRIHAVEIIIGEGALISCALNILDKLNDSDTSEKNEKNEKTARGIEFLLGLDMLKKYQVTL